MPNAADILIVEPHPRLRAHFERLLLGAGHRITLTSTPAGALHHLDMHATDLVLIGPGVDEDEDLGLLDALRARASLLQLPAIVVSRARDEQRTGLLLKRGATDVLPEPRAAAMLVPHIAHLLDLRQHPPTPSGPAPSGPITAWCCRACRTGLRHADRACPHCRAVPPPEGWPPIASSRFVDLGHTIDGRYRLEQVIGEGRVGVVYRATELESLAWHAIKVIDLSQDPQRPTDTRLEDRIGREVQALVALHSPHVVRVYDFCQLRPGAFGLVMDFIPGQSLLDHLDEHGPLSPATALDVFDQIGHALAEAHALGMVHRDLKPDNVILKPHRDDEFFATLLDFGLVEILQPAGDDRGFFGTLTWASPEQLRPGHTVDHRADVYSFGAVLFHAIAGSPPFRATHPAAMLSQHLKAPIPRLTERLQRPDDATLLPVDDLLQRLMQKSPDQRPGSMREVLDAFATIRTRWRQSGQHRARR